jgi:RNA polymerase sigma factor (sigma-70 family)
MDAEREFSQLMQRVQAGCPEAAQEVYDRYSAHVRRVVRRQLHQRMRAQFDSADFLQLVWASFFRTATDRYEFKDPKALVSFLCHVAFNKVVAAFHHQRREKRSIEREQALQIDVADRRVRKEPSPSELAIANECWERMLAGQPERGQTILEMLRQGHTHDEIADRLQLHPKVVQRLLRRISGVSDTS